MPKKTGIRRKMTSYHQLIGVAELKDINTAGKCRVVDCRFHLLDPDKGRAEYLEGHIPGALYADLDRDLASPVTAGSGRHPLPDAGEFCGTLERWGIHPDSQVVAYDQASGALAARLWWLLRWLGHTRVAVLDGGLNAWRTAGEVVETAVAEYPASEYRGLPDASKVTTTDEIVQAIGERRDLRLVDARDPRRFAGETEPIDTVAGHVPGAVNFPFSENVNADGTWKSPDALHRAWERVLGNDTANPVTVMCGSGVTACHLVLAAGIAGFDEPRVYVGSWSEWIRDRSRPITGGGQG
jgi:thiosulfate/3-mercaptopyruvate sulfurtransferase